MNEKIILLTTALLSGVFHNSSCGWWSKFNTGMLIGTTALVSGGMCFGELLNIKTVEGEKVPVEAEKKLRAIYEEHGLEVKDIEFRTTGKHEDYVAVAGNVFPQARRTPKGVIFVDPDTIDSNKHRLFHEYFHIADQHAEKRFAVTVAGYLAMMGTIFSLRKSVKIFPLAATIVGTYSLFNLVGPRLILSMHRAQEQLADNFALSKIKDSPKDLQLALTYFQKALDRACNLPEEDFYRVLRREPGTEELRAFLIEENRKHHSKHPTMIERSQDLYDALLRSTDQKE